LSGTDHAPGQEPELEVVISFSTLFQNSLILITHSISQKLLKMGFLSSVVMGSSAFILGMVFVCQVVSPLLFLFFLILEDVLGEGRKYLGKYKD